MQDNLQMRQDSISNELSGDTVFVPLYLFRDSTLSESDSVQSPAFQEYVIQILTDSLPVLEPQPSLLKEKTYVSHPQMPLKPLAKKENQDWEFVSLFLVLALLAVFFKFFPHGIFEIIRSCFSTKNFEIMTKSGNPLLFPTACLFFPIAALLAFCTCEYFEIPLNDFLQMNNIQIILLFLLSIFAFIGIKQLLVLFFGSFFRCKNIAKGYVFNQISYLFLDTIVLFLPVALSIFTPQHSRLPFILVSLGLFALLSIARVSRGLFWVFNTSKFSRIYLFCYLCTVEFVPLLFVLKVLFPK